MIGLHDGQQPKVEKVEHPVVAEQQVPLVRVRVQHTCAQFFIFKTWVDPIPRSTLEIHHLLKCI